MKRGGRTGRWAGRRPASVMFVLLVGGFAGVGCWRAAPVPSEPPSRVTQAAPNGRGQKPVAAAQRPKKKAAQKKKPAQNKSKHQPKPELAEDSLSKPAGDEHETIKLAHGQEVQIEKWGDTFEAYEYRPPVDLNDQQVEEVIWYKDLGGGRGGGGGPKGLAVDSQGGKLYWAHTSGGFTDGKIIRSTLDEKQVTYLVE